jgi:hypothetical protein
MMGRNEIRISGNQGIRRREKEELEKVLDR